MKSNIFILCIYVVAVYLLISADWRIAVGVMLFTWALNLENRKKYSNLFVKK